MILSLEVCSVFVVSSPKIKTSQRCNLCCLPCPAQLSCSDVTQQVGPKPNLSKADSALSILKIPYKYTTLSQIWNGRSTGRSTGDNCELSIGS